MRYQLFSLFIVHLNIVRCFVLKQRSNNSLLCHL
ncbi:hypothetical protein EUBVEN_00530 [Eubacterium ventriosum ATCC 27560]|uniref:Uncharacterized protein n=1 Tax=Eubacterium ventriosum ATCC 27560 TaxID=411463 RepID=A5Z4A7_9FIRM|nr:hypothetical protein EUBVEN_00530 [Eubacterium ventriosum ATCC 27560]